MPTRNRSPHPSLSAHYDPVKKSWAVVASGHPASILAIALGIAVVVAVIAYGRGSHDQEQLKIDADLHLHSATAKLSDCTWS